MSLKTFKMQKSCCLFSWTSTTIFSVLLYSLTVVTIFSHSVQSSDIISTNHNHLSLNNNNNKNNRARTILPTIHQQPQQHYHLLQNQYNPSENQQESSTPPPPTTTTRNRIFVFGWKTARTMMTASNSPSLLSSILSSEGNNQEIYHPISTTTRSNLNLFMTLRGGSSKKVTDEIDLEVEEEEEDTDYDDEEEEDYEYDDEEGEEEEMDEDESNKEVNHKYDPMLMVPPMQNMGVTLGVMLLTKRLDLSNVKTIRYIR